MSAESQPEDAVVGGEGTKEDGLCLQGHGQSSASQLGKMRWWGERVQRGGPEA